MEILYLTIYFWAPPIIGKIFLFQDYEVPAHFCREQIEKSQPTIKEYADKGMIYSVQCHDRPYQWQ